LASDENRFSKIETDLLLLKWMVGSVIALNVAILARLLFH
jgi:hypothetical protein